MDKECEIGYYMGGTDQKRIAVCEVSRICGGCQLVETPYAQQLAQKQRAMEDLFAPVLGKERLVSALRPIMGMSEPWHYRNKVISPFAPELRKGKSTGKILTGMYKQGTHQLVNTDGCLLENEAANQVVAAVHSIALKYHMEPYNEDTGEGFLRHVVVRVGHNSNEMLVTVVTNGEEFVGAKNFCKELVRRCPQVTTVVQNINTRQTNVVLGEKERTLYGPGFILDRLCGLSFRISAHSFYQVNATQTQVLYEQAITAAGLTGSETIIDAYCGTGTIGLVAARGVQGGKGAARVIGVDSVAQAIDDARLNAKHNGIENATFVAADATAFMERLAQDCAARNGEVAARSGNCAARNGEDDTRNGEGAARSVDCARGTAAGGEGVNATLNLDPSQTVLMMDPPRAGSTEAFLTAAAQVGLARIVYISCNPETQVRDITFLKKFGYEVQFVQPVDMFPCTPHVETVVLLSKVNTLKG